MIFKARCPILSKVLITNPLQRNFKRTVFTKKVVLTDQNMTIYARQMVEKDIPQVKELRKRNKFYDPVSLYATCLHLDPAAIIVADNGEGKVVGVLSGFRGIENEDVRVGGLRTVHEDYRLFGISSKVLNAQLYELEESRTVVVSVVLAEKREYQPYMPYLTRNFTNIEFESKQEIYPERLSSYVPQGVKIQKFDDTHMTTLLEYDHLASGYVREALIKFHCHDPHIETVTALENGKCVGYGSIKLDIQGGKKVGPLYADSPEIAEALLKQLLESFQSAKGFHGNALSNNALSIFMFQKLGEFRTFINYRICNKDISWSDYNKVYSVFENEIQPI